MVHLAAFVRDGLARGEAVAVAPIRGCTTVTDDGAAPPGPLAGYLPPKPGVIGGMGLWPVQQLCDAMAIHSTDGLTRARFAMHRSPA